MTAEPLRPGRARTALLLATVFVAGAAVMVLEMSAVRAVQPFFGSTTWVWTNVIAVVLAALALGYAVGGRLAQRRPSARLLYGLLATGALLVAAGALLVTPVALLFLEEGLDLEGVVSVLRWGSLGTAAAVFAPPVFLLATLSPLAVRLLAGYGVGRAAGTVLALSTLGSIVGTYLPALLLVPHLGSRGAILVAAAALLATAGLGFAAFGRRRGGWMAIAALGAAVGATLVAGSARARPGRPPPRLGGGKATVLAEVESPYQYLTVRDDRAGDRTDRVLTINEGVYSFHALQVPGRMLTGSAAYDAYAALPFALDLATGDRLDACVLGSACGVNARQWHHFHGDRYALHVDGAEIDPEVTRLGERFFDLPAGAPWLRVFDVDGRSLLACLPRDRRYDLLVVDAFAQELYVPFHLATREFFVLCRRRLERGGLLAMNVYASRQDGANRAAIERTMAAVFPAVVRVAHADTPASLLLAAPDVADATALAARIRAALARPHSPAPGAVPAEWDDLLDLAVRMAVRVEEVTSRSGEGGPGPTLLTDDHAPLAWLTDRALAEGERELRAERQAWASRLAALRARQDRRLGLVGAGWVVLLAFAAWRSGPGRARQGAR